MINNKSVVYQRMLSYWLTAILLTGSYFLLRGSSWKGSEQLHTLMEVAATLLALIIGVMALVCFYSKKNNTLLLICYQTGLNTIVSQVSYLLKKSILNQVSSELPYEIQVTALLKKNRHNYLSHFLA